MNKGFNRVEARCNKVFVTFAFVIGLCSHSTAQENVIVPEKRPNIETNQVATQPAKPKRAYQSACPAVLNKLIKTRHLPPIKDGECGERSPMAFQAITLPTNTIKLSTEPQVNCRTATAMAQWSVKANEAAKAAFDSTIATILTGPGYHCRRRNNKPDGKISEHGFANAMDITGFRLENGKKISVLRDWGETAEDASIEGLFLRTVHKAACSSFSTVLGPDANQYHKDHFHFDLGCHGKNCTYLLCE